MTETAMAAALKKAGIKPPIERLHEIIRSVLTYSQDPGVVQAAIVKKGDVEAALSLIDPQVIAARLRAVIKELARSGNQALLTQQQGLGARNAERASGGDHAARTDGQPGTTPTAKSRDVHVREHSRHKPGHAKPKSVAVKHKLALSAYKGIFGREIGSGRKVVGDVTKFDILQIKRRGMIDSTIADGLLELEWPDDHKTTLMAFASEDQVTAVFNRAYRVLDQLGIAQGTA